MINNIKFSLLAIEAKDLFASDSNGFSDPYFKIPHKQNGVVDIPGKKNRSQTIKKNLNPVWNHNFDVEFNPQKCNQLKIEVYDYDILKSKIKIQKWNKILKKVQYMLNYKLNIDLIICQWVLCVVICLRFNK